MQVYYQDRENFVRKICSSPWKQEDLPHSDHMQPITGTSFGFSCPYQKVQRTSVGVIFQLHNTQLREQLPIKAAHAEKEGMYLALPHVHRHT